MDKHQLLKKKIFLEYEKSVEKLKSERSNEKVCIKKLNFVLNHIVKLGEKQYPNMIKFANTRKCKMWS